MLPRGQIVLHNWPNTVSRTIDPAILAFRSKGENEGGIGIAISEIRRTPRLTISLGATIESIVPLIWPQKARNGRTRLGADRAPVTAACRA
jgi:hypothetical protein